MNQIRHCCEKLSEINLSDRIHRYYLRSKDGSWSYVIEGQTSYSTNGKCSFCKLSLHAVVNQVIIE